MTEWKNWSKRLSCRPSDLLRPGNSDDIGNIVRRARTNNDHLRVTGAGHSFSKLVPTDDTLISLDQYTGLTAVDPADKKATVRAGTSLSRLGERLYDHGLAMENLGDIDRQSLAGAISTGTHGTGTEFGILSTQVSAIKMMTPGRGWLECSRDTNPEVFQAARVSLGALGILTEVTLDLEPAYNLRESIHPDSLDNCLEHLEDFQDNYRHFEFFWFPGTETVLLKGLKYSDETGTVPDWTVRDLWENAVFETVCRLGTWFPAAARYLNKICATGARNTENTGPAHRIFPSMRSVRFNEMEYGVPASAAKDALNELRNWINRTHPEVQFPVEYRYVEGDNIPLSPACGEDRVFLAVHKYHRKPYDSFFRGAENIFKRYDGRPHWGKIHYRTAAELRDLYPEWERFQTVRRKLDPEGVFLNPYLRDLLEV